MAAEILSILKIETILTPEFPVSLALFSIDSKQDESAGILVNSILTDKATFKQNLKTSYLNLFKLTLLPRISQDTFDNKINPAINLLIKRSVKD
jgi:hypothetical protein